MTTNNKAPLLFLHFVLLNLISFGWICAIPIMVDHIHSVFNSSATFFQLVLLSTVIGLSTNLLFGRWVDKTSSRRVLVVGLIFNFVFWLLLASSRDPYVITFAFILEGIAFSALLIARAPYFHELISTIKSPSHYTELEGNTKIGMLVVMLGLLLGGGYLYTYSPVLPFYLNVAIVILALLLVLFYARQPLSQEGNPETLSSNIINDLQSLYKKHPNVFWVATSEGVFAALTPYFFFVVNLHLLDIGASVLFVSYLIASVYLARIIGAYLVRHSRSAQGVMLSLIGIAALTALMAAGNNMWWVAGLFLAGSICKEFIEVYLIADVTQSSPNHLKGSIRSYSELLSNTGILIIMVVMSLYADAVSSAVWVAGYSVLFLFTMGLYALSQRRLASPVDS